MSNIFEFPSASDRNEREIEKSLREGLAGNGFTNEGIEAAVALAMPLIRESKTIVAKNLQVTLRSPMSEEQAKELQTELSGALQQYQRDVGDFVRKLILQLALTKVKSPHK